MNQLSVVGHLKNTYKSFPLTKIVLFLSAIILDTILIIHQQTNQNELAVIYFCLFAVVFFLSHSHEKATKTPIGRNIIFLWILMLFVISFEYSLVILGNSISSLQYASFVHFIVKYTGLFSSLLCFLCLFIENHLAVYRRFIFLFSFIILASSVYIFLFLHNASLDRTLNFWWVRYCIQGGGIILVGSLGAVCFSLLGEYYNKI